VVPEHDFLTLYKECSSRGNWCAKCSDHLDQARMNGSDADRLEGMVWRGSGIRLESAVLIEVLIG
jgi:hypothetical protein